ncbi:MAG: AEC family transporter [Alphaproteobacteria bacterium]|nr:AEC family transporter [Alphaproteobacteria bacterium]
MLEIVLTIAPIFLLIVLGNILRRNGIPSVDFWNINDKLVYWVLFPALLFKTTSTLTLSGSVIGYYAIVILGGFFAAVIYSLLAMKVFKISAPSGTSLLQGCSRHNTFIALAVAERLFGADGLALAAMVTAVLIPVTNIVVVTSMVSLLPKKPGRSLPAAILRDLTRNPLLVSIVIGMSLNLLGVGAIPVLHQTAAILGAAALPIMLLCIGANLHFTAMRAGMLPTYLSMFGKFIVFPAAVFGLVLLTGLDGKMAIIPLIFACVPTAASSFTLARQMGGDAPLAASIVTIQTLISFLSLPLAITLLGHVFGLSF